MFDNHFASLIRHDTMNNSPIGVFDSGMGGLSVWRELRAALPHESLVYYGDGANCPYGEKSSEEVLEYIKAGVERLVSEGVKMVILACNTATVIAIKQLREMYDIPFVGMEPALKPAAGSTESGVVGVLATRGTIESEWFADLRSRYGEDTEIISAEGEGFVRLVEAGGENTPRAAELVRRAVQPLLDAGADRIVLGCTHYPFLRGRIEEVIGSRKVEIIDPAPAVVRRTEWLLDECGLRAEPGHVPDYRFMSAADDDYLKRLETRAFAG